MNRTITSALGLAAVLAAGGVAAQATDTTFDDGSMLLLCVAPDTVGDETSDAVFEQAFPKLVEDLQIRANEGKVVRVHFLTNLRDGLFIVVGGEDAADAANNALELQAESLDILAEAIESVGATDDAPAPEYCRMIPIGPVAVLPMK